MKYQNSCQNDISCSKEKANQSSNKICSDYVSDTCIQILAWMLLTVGLCIIASVAYVAFRQSSTKDDLARTTTDDYDFSSVDDNNGNFNFSVNLLGRAMEPTSDTYMKQGCSEIRCRLLCSNNRDVYNDTSAAMNGSSCGLVTSLVISNQYGTVIKNNWIKADFTVLKIVLTKSHLTKIKSDAFNSPIFAKVFHMSWTHLQIDELAGGVLLGLYSLRKLEIDSKLPITSMSFLQPVQTTLTHLRLNAGINFDSNSSLFNDIYFERLIHLDLSHNKFRGPLSKRLLSATPNVTYLHLTYCSIRSIEDDAFADIAHNLKLVNLAHNLFTTISSQVFLTNATGLSPTFIELEPNNWHCNCLLQSMVEFYSTHASYFMSAPYCRMPYSFFGKHFDELDMQEMNCDSGRDSLLYSSTDTTVAIHDAAGLTTTMGQTSVPSNDFSINDNYMDTPTHATTFAPVLEFSCSQAIDLGKSSKSRCIEEYSNVESYLTGTLAFEPPMYDLNLELSENYSVRAQISDYDKADQLNIIWFSEQFESEDSGQNTSQIDYNCMQYEDPFLTIDPLRENRTYTFCMMPKDEVVISPLFCQPLHVPSVQSNSDTEDILVANNQKQFTVAMICVIFFMSTVFGAIIAYLGIKAYPDLLEGSKHVLVIKELDKTCYVSTISESQFKKRPLKGENSLDSLGKKNQNLERPSSVSTILGDVSVLDSLKSSSTNFESSFSNMGFQIDEYEMPKQLYGLTEHCKLNNYEESPNFPPPLPKRNSNV